MYVYIYIYIYFCFVCFVYTLITIMQRFVIYYTLQISKILVGATVIASRDDNHSVSIVL